MPNNSSQASAAKPSSSAASSHKAAIDKAFQDGWELANLPRGGAAGWNLARTTSLAAAERVDKAEWRMASPEDDASSVSGGRRRKMFRVTAALPASVENVSAVLRKVESMPNWNAATQESKILKRLDTETMITYHVTGLNRSLIFFPRDFVSGIKFGFIDGCFVAGGCSVDYPVNVSSESWNVVRGHTHLVCMVVRPMPGNTDQSTFQMVTNTDLQGWIPDKLQDIALPLAQIMFVDSLKQVLKKKLEEEKSPEKAQPRRAKNALNASKIPRNTDQ